MPPLSNLFLDTDSLIQHCSYKELSLSCLLISSFFMSCSVTSVFTFKIESTFDEWAAIFDSAEGNKRHSEFNIKPLFRGVSKEDPQKVIVIHQAPVGNVQKFVEANGDWMATHRVDLSTMEESSWTASLTKDSCCD